MTEKLMRETVIKRLQPRYVGVPVLWSSRPHSKGQGRQQASPGQLGHRSGRGLGAEGPAGRGLLASLPPRALRLEQVPPTCLGHASRSCHSGT